MPQTLSNPRFWIGLVVSLVALAIAAMRVEWAEALDAFQQAQYVWLLPAVACSIGSLVARAARWRALFHPTRLPFGRVFGLLAIGYTVTTVLPFRLGDVARVYLVGRLHDVAKARAASTIVVERVLDILTVLVVLVVLAPVATLPSWVRTSMWAAAGAVTLGGAIMAAGWFRRRRTQQVVTTAVGWLPDRWVERIRGVVDSVIDGFSVLESGSAAGKAVGWSTATWLSGGLLMWALLRAFGLPGSFVVALFLLATSAIAMVIPSSPGFVGVYHALIIEALVVFFGAASGPAASFAVTSHLLLFAPPVFIGIGYLVKEQAIWNTLSAWRHGKSDDRDTRQPDCRRTAD